MTKSEAIEEILRVWREAARESNQYWPRTAFKELPHREWAEYAVAAVYDRISKTAQ